ncbi:hypothetical protein L603_002200000220 [Cellulosimicrobium cellulans J34]|nr:hypothetical protein L603_002200000220 [Cellulosimicrobium cellulans J34]
MALGPLRDPALRVVQGERRGHGPDVLGGVGVAEHDLDPAAVLREPALHLRQREHRLEDVHARTQVGEGLEQRDRVDDGHLVGAGERELRELVHGREVLGLLREGHDVAARGADAVALLDRAERAERVEHLARAVGQVAVQALLRDLRERSLVDLGVLAHLELGEVEPERLDLPHQLLQVPVRGARGARRDERLLHDAQVGLELLGRRVREVRVAGARRGDAVRHDEHDGAVRLARRRLRGRRRHGLREPALALPQRAQTVRRRRAVLVERELAADEASALLERRERVVGRDRGGLARDLGRHVGVAVAVAADPRPEAHERADQGLLAAGLVAEQPVVEAAVDRGERVEHRGVEDPEGRLHLVEHGRLVLADRRRAPHRVDLREQAALVLRERRAAEPLRVALVEQRRDAADGAGDRAPARLRRVRGEHGAELEPAQAAQRLLAAHLGDELLERLGQRVVGRRGARRELGLALTQHAHAVVLLREVREVEVAREGARDLLGALHRQALDEGLGLGQHLARGVVVRADRELAQALDVVEQVLAARLAQHGAEQTAEEADVVAQRGGHVVAREPAPGAVPGDVGSTRRRGQFRGREVVHGDESIP